MLLKSGLQAAAGVAERGIARLAPLAPEAEAQRRTLEELGHRPWPLPHEPWLMGQTWLHLLFAHWRVDPDELRPVVPPQLPLDTRDGSAWIGVTPFVVKGLRLRGAPPIPRASEFPELNVRTYVTVDGKPGIFFHSLDADSRLAVVAARRAYRLPYFQAEASLERTGDGFAYSSERNTRPPAGLRARYQPKGSDPEAGEGSLARWLAERYCLYTLDEEQRVLRADIHHPPWPLQRASAEIDRNTMTVPIGVELHGEPVLHYSARQDTLIWPLREAG